MKCRDPKTGEVFEDIFNDYPISDWIKDQEDISRQSGERLLEKMNVVKRLSCSGFLQA